MFLSDCGDDRRVGDKTGQKVYQAAPKAGACFRLC